MVMRTTVIASYIASGARRHPSARGRAHGARIVRANPPGSAVHHAREGIARRGDDARTRAIATDDKTSWLSMDVVREAAIGDALRLKFPGENRASYLEVEEKISATSVRGSFRGVDAVLEVCEETNRVLLSEIIDGTVGKDGKRKTTRLSRETFTRSFDGWTTTLETLRRSGEYPAPGFSRAIECEEVTRLCSLDELRARVLEDASFWTDGSPKDFEGLSADEHATLNAGEILAFQCGWRPICMVQLWTGWEDDLGRRQSIDMPFVTRLLKEISQDDEVGIITVAPPGASEKLGITALLYPRKSPYKERAKLLASFGAQAALVAGSPYYQTLIGRCLGYKEENIGAHVQQYNKGIGISKQISDLVEEELSALSAVPVLQRWRDGFARATVSNDRPRNRRKKKSNRASSNLEEVEMMFGRRRK